AGGVVSATLGLGEGGRQPEQSAQRAEPREEGELAVQAARAVRGRGDRDVLHAGQALRSGGGKVLQSGSAGDRGRDGPVRVRRLPDERSRSPRVGERLTAQRDREQSKR